MSSASPILRAKVQALLREGRGAEAIREYRNATRCDLATARRAIEALALEADVGGAEAPDEPPRAEPVSPFPPADDAPVRPNARAEPVVAVSPPPVPRWQPADAPPPTPTRPVEPRSHAFVVPPPRPTFGSSPAPRPRTGPPKAPSSSDLAVVFALALLLAALLGGGLLVALLLAR